MAFKDKNTGSNYEQLLSQTVPASCVLLYKREGLDFQFLVAERLVPPDKGRICIPGGRIEPGEIPKTAARRELYEETGVSIGDRYLLPLVYSFQVFLNSQKSFSLFCYFTSWSQDKGEPYNKEPDKHTDWRWISLQQLLEKLEKDELTLGLKAAVERLVENSERSNLPRSFFGEYRALR